MAIRYYDQAIVEKIKKWVKDPNLRILSPNDSTRLFQMVMDQNNDKPLQLPLIAISRDPEMEIISTTKKPLTYDGGHINNNKERSEVLNAIPIKLSYQIDIYTKTFAEADEYTREFIFKLINYPNIRINIPYNDAMVDHESTILVESSVSDNSDIPERLISGQFTRMTIKLTIDDAYLFSIPFMANWKTESGDIDVIDK